MIPQLDGNCSISDSSNDSVSEINSLPSFLSSNISEILLTYKETSSDTISSELFGESWYTQYSLTSSELQPSHIPVIIGNRPASNKLQYPRNPTRTTIRKSNDIVQAGDLPALAAYNMRSLFPKVKNLCLDINEREIGIACLSEIWEKSESVEHQLKTEEMLEMNSLEYISNPRRGKRGGGTAIIANTKYCTVEKIHISPPQPLEVTWALVKPLSQTAKFKNIIVASFYAPPRTRKSAELLEHLTCNTQLLLLKYPNAGIVIAGDRNNVTIERLLSIDHSLKVIVTKPTINMKTLDVILTNMHKIYNEAKICPPPKPDILNNGEPSDHSVPICYPRTISSQPKREYRTRTYRPYPDSGIRSFGQWLQSQDWTLLNGSASPNNCVKIFEDLFFEKLDTYLPIKEVRCPMTEKPWITHELSQLSRKKQREYVKHGKSSKYNILRKQFDLKQKEAIKHYREKLLEKVTHSGPYSGYAALKKMGEKLGEDTNDQINLPIHQGMTNEQICNDIASHFSAISQEYEPLDMDNLPLEIKKKISEIKETDIPQLSELQVYHKILSTKKPNSSLPMDIPRKIIEEFSVELAMPMSIIFNNSLKHLEYPDWWKKEYAIPLAKVPNPEKLDDLRVRS